MAALFVPTSAAAHDALCVELWNPHGQTTPPAGSTTLPGARGGQNEDGFYEVGSCLFSGSFSCPTGFGPPIFAGECTCNPPEWERPVFLFDGCEAGNGTGWIYDANPATPCNQTTRVGCDAFPFGTVVKFIEANGKAPGQQPMAGSGQPGSPAGDSSDSVEWQLWGQGDLRVCAAEDPSFCTCCLVPPLPK
jgi:hypothetical protein